MNSLHLQSLKQYVMNLGFYFFQVQAVQEIRERHPRRQCIQVDDGRWQVARRHHDFFFGKLCDVGHVLDGQLAAKQQGDAFELALLHRQANVIVDLDEAFRVHQVFGECACGRGAATKDAHGQVVGLLLAATLVGEVGKHIEEGRALLDHADGADAIHDAPQAGRV